MPHEHTSKAIVCLHLIHNYEPLGFVQHEEPLPERLDSGWAFGCEQEEDHELKDLTLICMECWLPRLEGISPGFWRVWEDKIPLGFQAVRSGSGGFNIHPGTESKSLL